MQRSRRWMSLVPVAVLLLGIGVHGARIVIAQEDPQRGSAFAMFATVDIASTRRVEVTVPADGSRTLPVPAALAEEALALRESPTPARARAFGERLLAESRPESRTDGDDSQAQDAQAPESLRVRVVGLSTEGASLTRVVLTDVVVPGAGS